MTQALLNNLNILSESKLNLNDKFANDNIADFAKILQEKTPIKDTKEAKIQTTEQVSDTNKINNNTNNINTNTITNTINNTNNIDNTDNTNIVSTLGDLKENLKDDFEGLEDIIKEAIIETEIIEVLTPAIDEETADSTTQTDTDAEISEETNTLPTDQENTITDEETTMTNDELIYQPLENPATAMMLQSQLQKHAFKDNSNQNTDENENSNANFKTTELTKNLKSYENIQNEEKSIVLTDLNDKKVSVEKAEDKKLSDIIEKRVIEDLNIEALESESAQSEEFGNLMNNQSPQEQAVKAIMHADAAGNSKFEFVSAAQSNKAPTETAANKIIEQISKQIENMYNGSKVNIVLNPEHLGKVSLQILSLKEGISAQFTVTTQDAQNMIMKGLAGLKESLLAHGINVDNVTVKLQETGDNEHHFDWTEQEGSRGGNKQQHSHKEKDKEKQFEQMMFEFSENGNV